MVQVTPRAVQKQQTRRLLLSTALRLMEHQSLGSLSLREVTRAAGLAPAAFYRHFPDMDRLGVALVEESLEPLRAALRAVRVGLSDSDEIIRQSVALLSSTVRANRGWFRFVARERHGQIPLVRLAIRDQLRGFADELARDLLAGPVGAVVRLGEWPAADVQMLTQLAVNQMVVTAAALLDPPEDDPAAEAVILATATTQLRLIVVGARHWLDRDT